MSPEDKKIIEKMRTQPQPMVNLESHLLLELLNEAHAALRMSLARATVDPDHDYRKCSEPSCVLGRKALGEE